jgi:ribose transport system ATP-binding protein
MPSNDLILEMKNIIKNFPGVRALDDVTVDLKKGEILGLLGENGAGKSTLIKILAGVYALETGEIIIDGKSLKFATPKESLDNGIRVIYQELSSFDPITVVENIFAGEVVLKRFGIVDWGKMVKEAKRILSEFGSELNPLEIMENLTVAEKQIVEIAKAVHTKARIVVMDEPTSALNEKDVQTLYSIMRKLKKEGVSIIYITHRLEEIIAVTDRAVVLRDGKKVGDVLIKETTKQDLVNMIVGKSFSELYPKQDIAKGEILLEVKNLSYLNKIQDISFHLRKGEIVAFFGLVGSGTHLVFKVLFGDLKKTAGDIFIEGKKIEIKNPVVAKKNSMGFVPIDRKEEGIALSMDVKTNVVTANIDDIGKGVRFNRKIEKARANQWIEKLSIKTPSLDATINNLSGGNQQKVVVAKWMECDSKILLMAEPTRGIDVGSKAEIYGIAEDLCKKGAGVVIVSSELPEIMAISDRVIVMKRGRIAREYNTKETTQEELMHMVSS